MRPGRTWVILVAVDLASDGTSLVLFEAEPQFGTLLIEPSNTSACLTLWSDAACQYLSRGNAWQIPAGRYKAVNAEEVSVSPTLVGCGGEEYQMDVRRNNRRPPEREFKIIDEKETVLTADKLQYG